MGGRGGRQVRVNQGYHGGRQWTLEVVSSSFYGSANCDLRQFTLRFSNQLGAMYTLSGDKVPRRIKREGSQQVAIEGTMLFQDQSLFQEFLDQSEKRLLLTFAGETVAQSYQAQVTLDVPKLRFGEFKPGLSGPGQLAVSFTAAGVSDSTSSYALRATLTNPPPAF